MAEGSHYRDFVAEGLTAERDRRARLDDRSASVTTTSSALTALVVALIAFMKGARVEVSLYAAIVAIFALVLFAAASGLAMVSGMLREYKVPTGNALDRMLRHHWRDTESDQLLACAWMDLETLLTTRRVDNAKAWWLDQALWTQVAAFAALVVGAFLAIL